MHSTSSVEHRDVCIGLVGSRVRVWPFVGFVPFGAHGGSTSEPTSRSRFVEFEVKTQITIKHACVFVRARVTVVFALDQ